MNNYIILGHPRSGKTILANLLSKNVAYSVISLDNLSYAFGKVFPGLNITGSTNDLGCENFVKFIEAYLSLMVKYDNPLGMYCIIEGDSIKAEDAIKYLGDSDNQVVILGKPKLTPQQLFEQVRRAEEHYGGWTVKRSDDSIIKLCKEWVERANTDKKLSETYGITFLDTSYNYQVLIEFCGGKNV